MQTDTRDEVFLDLELETAKILAGLKPAAPSALACLYPHGSCSCEECQPLMEKAA